MKKPSKKSKRKPKSTAKIIDECAVLMQKLVRLKAADSNGFCTCVTSGVKKHWKEMQGGHFIERGKLGTKLMEENIHPQTPYENQYGMQRATTVLKYRQYMVDMYGEDFVEEMLEMSRQVKKYTRAEALEIHADLKIQVKEAEQRVEQLRPTQEDGY